VIQLPEQKVVNNAVIDARMMLVRLLLSTGGHHPLNVLVNDTLNGNPNASCNGYFGNASTTTNPGVTLNPANGSVNVVPGTPLIRMLLHIKSVKY
jgi:hypothetical protein